MADSEITRKVRQPARPILTTVDIIAKAFDALLAQERAQVLMWACEYLRINGRPFDGSFWDLRGMHKVFPDKLEPVTAYLALEVDVAALRSKHCP